MFRLIKYRLYALGKLKPCVKGIKHLFFINLFLSMVIVITEFIIPLLYKIFIEKTIVLGRWDTFYPVLIIYIVIHFSVIAIQYLKNYWNNRIRNHVAFRVKLKLWQNLFKCDFEDYERTNIGDTKMYIEDDVQVLMNFSSYYTIDYFIKTVTLWITVLILFAMEWRLALFAIISIPVTSIIDTALGKREMLLNAEQRENDQEMNTWLYNSLQSWKEVKALNLQKRQNMIFTKHIKKYALYYAKWINYWTLRALVLPKIRNEFLARFGLYFFGGLLVMNGHMSIGSLLVFASYFEILTAAILEVSNIDADLQGKCAYIDRLFEKLDIDYHNEDGEDIDSIQNIVLKNVSFCYSQGRDIIKNVSLEINRGDRVAIIGKSGCGKTTLLKLIVGILKANSGEIFYSSKKDVKISSLHKKIGFIMQNNHLYNMSIRENLMLGNTNATEAELEDACRKACIWDYVKTLPDGLDTVVGEGSCKLSGGQKQRLVLARTFLRDVDVYIFDEATSAIDQYSEKIINDAIANIGEDKIIIIVAHRESSIQLCDTVINMNNEAIYN